MLTLAVKSWENNWNKLTPFLEFPQEIRKLIYTTNIIASLNASLRKYTKNKRVFPADDAALKSIFLAAQQIKSKWEKSLHVGLKLEISWLFILNLVSLIPAFKQ